MSSVNGYSFSIAFVSSGMKYRPNVSFSITFLVVTVDSIISMLIKLFTSHGAMVHVLLNIDKFLND